MRRVRSGKELEGEIERRWNAGGWSKGQFSTVKDFLEMQLALAEFELAEAMSKAEGGPAPQLCPGKSRQR